MCMVCSLACQLEILQEDCASTMDNRDLGVIGVIASTAEAKGHAAHLDGTQRVFIWSYRFDALPLYCV